MRSIVDRNLVMWRMTVYIFVSCAKVEGLALWDGLCYDMVSNCLTDSCCQLLGLCGISGRQMKCEFEAFVKLCILLCWTIK
jgi:hypothetical protein